MTGSWNFLLWRASADNNNNVLNLPSICLIDMEPWWVLCRTDLFLCERWCCWKGFMAKKDESLRGGHPRGKGQGRNRRVETEPEFKNKARARNKYHKGFWRCRERMKLSQKLFQEKNLQRFHQSGRWGELQGHVYRKSPIRVMWFLSAKLFRLNKRLLLPRCWILFHHRETQRHLTWFMALDKWQLSVYNSLKGSWCFNKS